MDRYEVCELVGDWFASTPAFSRGRIEQLYAEGASLYVETDDGQRFRLDVTMEGRVCEP